MSSKQEQYADCYENMLEFWTPQISDMAGSAISEIKEELLPKIKEITKIAGEKLRQNLLELEHTKSKNFFKAWFNILEVVANQSNIKMKSISNLNKNIRELLLALVGSKLSTNQKIKDGLPLIGGGLAKIYEEIQSLLSDDPKEFRSLFSFEKTDQKNFNSGVRQAIYQCAVCTPNHWFTQSKTSKKLANNRGTILFHNFKLGKRNIENEWEIASGGRGNGEWYFVANGYDEEEMAVIYPESASSPEEMKFAASNRVEKRLNKVDLKNYRSPPKRPKDYNIIVPTGKMFR
jgi:hypothetical protein|tara:strand:- start:5402 stop:6271 length:870 start_codon:yes stop_codon:yes gene_type:complete